MTDLTSKDILSLLRNRYQGNQYVVLEEVPNATGMLQSRWIDAAAFSLWPSKGLTRSAFEIKVSRSDFIRELQNPIKHQWVRQCFHEFWFVGPQDVFQLGEIPEGIGLMCPRGNTLMVKKHCLRNEKPILDDALLAAFMRAAFKAIDNCKKQNKTEVLGESKEYKRAREYESAVHAFCEGRGVSLYPEVESKEEICKALENANMDKELAHERAQLSNAAGVFQRRLTDLFPIFALIAYRGLLARDEMGKYLVSQFGEIDENSIEVLQGNNWNRKYAKVIDLIMCMGKEAESA